MPVTHKVRNITAITSTDIVAQHASNTQYLNSQTISGTVPAGSYAAGDTLVFANVPGSKIIYGLLHTDEVTPVQLQIFPGTSTASALSLTPTSGTPAIEFVITIDNTKSGSQPLEIKVVV